MVCVSVYALFCNIRALSRSGSLFCLCLAFDSLGVKAGLCALRSRLVSEL